MQLVTHCGTPDFSLTDGTGLAYLDLAVNKFSPHFNDFIVDGEKSEPTDKTEWLQMMHTSSAPFINIEL
ncbi:MAG: hypothetical protein WCO00_11295 [Rhodospirillaceae bacterium]